MENLHRTIPVVLSVFFNNPPITHVIRAPECGGDHRIRLFSTDHRSRATNYCWPDLGVIQNNQARVILEAEQSGIVSPGKIGGKLLSVLLSSHLCNEDINFRTIPISRDATFIQVVNTELLQPGTRKLLQYGNLEADIRRLLPIGCITRYFLFPVLADTAPPYGIQKYYPLIEAIRQSLS